MVPTRGDVGMDLILDSLAMFDELIVWDNSQREDLGIYGRYAAIAEARNDVIVTQDDDLLVHGWIELLSSYDPDVLTVNYPEPWNIPWVARGAVFHRDLPSGAFGVYLAAHPFDHLFTHYICDAVFGLLTPVNVLDLGSEDLPHCNAQGRISTSPGWYDGARPEAQRRCEALKVAA